MPVYQYVCRRCSHRFERLVMGERRPSCPACESEELERLPSVFAVRARAGREPARAASGACGNCGDPRGPGACSIDWVSEHPPDAPRS